MSITDPYAAGGASAEEKNRSVRNVDENESDKNIEKNDESANLKTTDESVPEGANVEEVLDWVGDDKERAKLALDSEESASKPRKSLVNKLKDLV